MRKLMQYKHMDYRDYRENQRLTTRRNVQVIFEKFPGIKQDFGRIFCFSSF